MTPSRTVPFPHGWRIAGWGALLALLALPAIAMRFTAEVHWTPFDFLAAGVMLALLGGVTELAFRIGRGAPGRAGVLLLGMACFLTVWTNGAVGMIGSENEPVNLAFVAMAAIALLLGLATRFRPSAMRVLLGVIAAGQFAVGLAATRLMPGHGVEWGVLAVFACLWAGTALLFHRAAAR